MSSRQGRSQAALPTAWPLYEQAVIRLTVDGVPMLLAPEPAGAIVGTFPYTGPVHVITAWNPQGRTLSEQENHGRHTALLAEPALAGTAVHDCAGGDLSGEHQEPSLLIESLTTDEGLSLGRRFGQDAIFRWTETTFDLLACVGGAAVARGWTLESQDAAFQKTGDGRSAEPGAARQVRS